MRRMKGGIVTSKGTLVPIIINHIPLKHVKQVIHKARIDVNIIAHKRVKSPQKLMHRGRAGTKHVREAGIKSRGLRDIYSTSSKQGGETSCLISSCDSSKRVCSDIHSSSSML